MEDQPDWKRCGIRRLANLESKVLCKVAISHPCPHGGIVSCRIGANRLELWPVNPEACLISIWDVKQLEVMINSEMYVRAEVKVKDLLLELSWRRNYVQVLDRLFPWTLKCQNDCKSWGQGDTEPRAEVLNSCGQADVSCLNLGFTLKSPKKLKKKIDACPHTHKLIQLVWSGTLVWVDFKSFPGDFNVQPTLRTIVLEWLWCPRVAVAMRLHRACSSQVWRHPTRSALNIYAQNQQQRAKRPVLTPVARGLCENEQPVLQGTERKTVSR